MLRKRACKYCAGQFNPIRVGHLYCSDTCRKLSFKSKVRAKSQAKRNKKLSEKLKKLVNSPFGKYLVKELRRAKTVEILQGHTSETLSALAQLRRRCTALGGYDDGNPIGYYELSHIYPVSGKVRLGLLNTSNLTITPKTFNRKHGTKLPIRGYTGSSAPRNSLLKEWKVIDSADSLDILKLTRKYLGEEFDNWLKKHLINLNQKDGILKKLKEAGYDNGVLKTMGLRELKAIANEEEIPYFSIDKDPNNEMWVVFDEMKRLKIDNLIFKHLELYIEADFNFYDFTTFQEPLEEKKFKEFLIHQAYLSIHGQPYEAKWKNKNLETYFKNEYINSHDREDSFYDDEIL